MNPKLLLATFSVSCSLLLPYNSAIAQISSANDGAGTRVNRNGNEFMIDGGTLSSDQQNLFHSFEEFGLSANEIANFLSNPNIENVLGRVVGGNASVIDGLITLTGGNSNLYLMNPAGVIFGSNARLDVPGSFTATTANGIGFDNTWFHAVGDNDYASLVGAPSAFAFSMSNPGSIFNSGELAVDAGQSLTLLGGTVINTGSLTAPGGTITVAAVPGENLVRISQEDALLSLELETLDTAEAIRASHRLTNAPNTLPFTPLNLPTLLAGSGLDHASEITVAADGTVRLTGSDTVIPTESGVAIASGTLDASSSHASADVPEINVLGDRVGILNATLDASIPSAGGTIRIGGDYQGQGSVFNASRTFINEDSALTANALEVGDGGRVIIWADETTGFYGDISARGGREGGDGGFVEVSGKQELIFRGDVDVSATNGMVGSLLLDPENITIVDGDGGANDAELADNEILAGDTPGATFTISETALEGLTANADVTLVATNDITINDLEDNNLNLPTAPSSSITFTALGGDFTMNPGDTITTQGGNLTISGNTVTLGRVDMSLGGNLSLRGNEIDLIGGDESIQTRDSLASECCFIAISPPFGSDQDIILGGTAENPNSLDVTQNDLNAFSSSPLNSAIYRIGTNGNLTIPDNPADPLQFNRNLFLNAGGTLTIERELEVSGPIVLRGSEIDLLGGENSIRSVDFAGDTRFSRIQLYSQTDQDIRIGAVDGTPASQTPALDLTLNDLAALQPEGNSITIGNLSGLPGSQIGDITVVDGPTPLFFDDNLTLQTNLGDIAIENQLVANTLSLEGNEIGFLGGNDSIVTDSLLLRSDATTPQNIVIAGTDNTTAALDITQTDLDAVQDGLSRLAFASGNGDISVIGDINIPTLVSLNASRTDASNTGAGSIDVQGVNITARAIDMFANDGIVLGNANLTSEIRNNFNGNFDDINGGAVAITNSTITTSDNITISGVGTANSNDGIVIGTSTINTDNGSINLTGIGQDGGTIDALRGVSITESTLETTDGNIEINGTGGDGTGENNTGLFVGSNSLIRSTGNLTLDGTATNNGVGVVVRDNATITSGSGDVNVTGIGGNSVPLDNGIYILLGGTIETTNGGSISLDGTAGDATNVGNNPNPDNANSAGVFINGVPSTVRAADGDITIIGRTTAIGRPDADRPANNTQGIRSSGLIEATGDGTITLIGTGGVGTDSNRGIQLVSTAQVRSENGDITLTGTGTGSGNRNEGIFLNGGVDGTPIVESTGTGDINLTGTGGDGVDQNFGVFIDDGAQVISNEGTLSVVGTGGNGVNQNIGIYVTDGAQINSNNRLSLTGIGRGSGIDNVGLEVDINSSIRSTNANLNITATDVVLDSQVNSGTGDITIQPVDTDSTIGIGNTAFGDLNISQDELTNLNTVGTVTIGNPITVDTNGQEVPLGDVQLGNIDLTDQTYDLTIQGGNINFPGNAPDGTDRLVRVANNQVLQLISTGAISENQNGDLELGNNSSVLLDAANDIGNTDGPAGLLEIGVRDNGIANIAARTRVSGEIALASASRLNVTSVGDVNGIRTAGNGSINMRAIALNAPIIADGTGNIRLRGFGGLTLNADIQSGSGDISITNSTIPNFRTIRIGTNPRTISTNGGTIDIIGGIEGDAVLTVDAGNGNVQLNDEIGVDALRALNPLLGLDIDAGDVDIQAPANLGSEGLDIDVSGAVAIANNIQTLNGGQIEINANRDISTASIRTVGGDIALTSENGDITATASLQTINEANNGNAGNGGDVFLIANNGNITTNSILTRSVVVGDGNAGSSGDIEIRAAGNISTRNLETNSSVTGSGNAGNGGAISVSAGGLLTLEGQVDSRSQVVSPTDGDRAGNGGNISFNAGDDINVDGRIISLSRASGASDGSAGDITVTSGADVELRSGSTTGTPQSINADAPGQRGEVQIEAAGDIRIIGEDSRPNSNSILARDFTLNAGDSVEIDLSVNTASIQAEDVAIDAGTDITLTNAPIESNEQVDLTAGGSIATDRITTEGGAIALANADTIRLRDTITTNGGNFRVLESDHLTLESSRISTNGGNFFYRNSDALQIEGTGQLSTTGGAIRLRGSDVRVDGAIALNSSTEQRDGGDVVVLADSGSVRIGNVDSSGQDGGDVRLVSPNRRVRAGDITTTGAIAGGDVEVNAEIAIRTRDIRSRGLVEDGGDVFLDPRLDIQVGFIDARGGTEGSGGEVFAFTERFFRSTNTFGNNISISTRGGQGSGDITINHDGGPRDTPFVVGNRTENGTVGTITSSPSNTITNGSFPGRYTLGNIDLITTDFPSPPPVEPPSTDPSPDATPNDFEPSAPVDEANPASEFNTPDGENETISSPSVVDPGVVDIDDAWTDDYIAYDSQVTPPGQTPSSLEPNTVAPDGDPSEGNTDSPQTPGFLGEVDPGLDPGNGNIPDNHLGEENLGNSVDDANSKDPTESSEFPGIEPPNGGIGDISGSQPGNESGFSNTTSSEDRELSLSEAQAHLRHLEQQTGIKPALIYAVFTPNPTVAASALDEEQSQETIDLDRPGQNDTDQLELLLVTASDSVIRIPVVGTQRADVLQGVRRFRNTLFTENTEAFSPDTQADHLEWAEQFHQWLIEPLEQELAEREIDTIAFLLDEGLRSLPLAALHDGDQYLVERFGIGLMPSLTLTSMDYVNINNADVLAMGASTFMETDQAPLPATEVETAIITDTLWDGEAFMNEAFSFLNLQEQRQDTPFGIVHLATHASFTRHRSEEAYIQMWGDERLRLSEIRQLGWHDPTVELVVLSACETAIGDANTELGFAGFSALAGVKSTLASLWTVDDAGTLGLMAEFYQQLSTAPIKAEALRRAQLAMLYGDVSIQDGRLVWTGGDRPLPQDDDFPEERSLMHPTFWAGFTMIGSPW